MGIYSHHIFICINEREGSNPRKSCSNQGIAIRNQFIKILAQKNLKIKIRVNKSGCLDECDFGPSLVIYPRGDWYTNVAIDDIPKIIEKSIIN